MASDRTQAEKLIACALDMNAKGINHGSSGNVSVRVGDALLLTPSGVPYDQLTPDSIIKMNFDASWSPLGNSPGDSPDEIPDEIHSLRPSSEWRFHLDVLAARSDVTAVVHAHPTAATALSTHSRGIEPFHYMVAMAGGRNIRCADYATFGTEQLSRNAVTALEDRRACLLAHHGILALGDDLGQALALAVEVEVLAAQYLTALAIGEPPLLSDAEMDEVLAKMAAPDGYGSAPTVFKPTIFKPAIFKE